MFLNQVLSCLNSIQSTQNLHPFPTVLKMFIRVLTKIYQL